MSVRRCSTLPAHRGEIRAFSLADFAEIRGPADVALHAALGSAEQSNTSVRYGDKLILKLFRRLERGPNVDYEMNRYLLQQGGFRRVPRLAGALEYVSHDGDLVTLGMMQEFVPNQGDGWRNALEELERYYERCTGQLAPPASLLRDDRSVFAIAAEEIPEKVRDIVGLSLEWATTLGRRTAEMHVAVAQATSDAAFAPEPISSDDLARLADNLTSLAGRSLELLAAGQASLTEEVQAAAGRVLELRPLLLAELSSLKTIKPGMLKTRIHGDYHLGQVLMVENDFLILDFEGEPARTLDERRQKYSPLKDVAGMLRSFSYAAYGALLHLSKRWTDVIPALKPWAALWETWTAAAFLQEYLAAAGDAPFVPRELEDAERLLKAFAIEKALYELAYEMDNRPTWMQIPLLGILRLAEGEVDDGY